MKKLSVCILFGGISPEHEVSLRSADYDDLESKIFSLSPALSEPWNGTIVPSRAYAEGGGQGKNLAFQIVIVGKAVIATGRIQHPISDINKIQQTAKFPVGQIDLHDDPPYSLMLIIIALNF